MIYKFRHLSKIKLIPPSTNLGIQFYAPRHLIMRKSLYCSGYMRISIPLPVFTAKFCHLLHGRIFTVLKLQQNFTIIGTLKTKPQQCHCTRMYWALRSSPMLGNISKTGKKLDLFLLDKLLGAFVEVGGCTSKTLLI